MQGGGGRGKDGGLPKPKGPRFPCSGQEPNLTPATQHRQGSLESPREG